MSGQNSGSESEDSDDGVNFVTPVGTRLTENTMERFERYRKNKDVPKSEAFRRLVREGLDELEDSEPESWGEIAQHRGEVAFDILTTTAVASVALFAVYMVTYSTGLGGITIPATGLSAEEASALLVSIALLVAIIAGFSYFLFLGLSKSGLADKAEEALNKTADKIEAVENTLKSYY